MSAIPQQLLSLPKVKGLKGIDNRVHRIYPTNASGATEFTYNGLNRIIFSIPSYKNGFFNPMRSFLHFQAKTGSNRTYFNAGLPIINRMVIRTGNGQLIEDIQDYSLIQRVLTNFEDESKIRGRANITGDHRSDLTPMDLGDLANSHFQGRTFSHDLLSGILGKAQEHYIPVGLFNATGGFSFEIELHLEDPIVACSALADDAGNVTNSLSYSLRDVSLQMEIVTLPSTVTDRLNSELQSESKVSIPFSTYRLHQAHFPVNSQSVDVNISESAHDLETVYTCMVRQNYALTKVGYGIDNYFLNGGTNSTNQLKAYQWRYDTKYYPDSKSEMASNDSKLALYNAIHTLDIADKPTFASMKNFWDQVGFCCIVQSFKSSRDNFLNSLNSSSTGAPLELQIQLRSPATEAMKIQSFVKSNYTLNIVKGGLTTVLNGTVTSTN